MNNFTCRKIQSQLLGTIEIYFCSFQSQETIDTFCEKCPWFDKQDATIGKRVVIEYDQEKNYYEMFELRYYQNHLQQLIQTYNNIYGELNNFFQQF